MSLRALNHAACRTVSLGGAPERGTSRREPYGYRDGRRTGARMIRPWRLSTVAIVPLLRLIVVHIMHVLGHNVQTDAATLLALCTCCRALPESYTHNPHNEVERHGTTRCWPGDGANDAGRIH